MPDQLGGCVCRIFVTAQQGRDLVVVELVEETIAAEHEAIAPDRVDRPDVDEDVGGHAEHAGDDVPLRVAFGVVRIEAPLTDEILDHRMVLGQLRELALPEDVRA